MADKPRLNPTARIAKNSLVQMAGGLFNKLLAVLLVIYAARQLGTTGFGIYSFVLTVLGIFYLVADFGLGTLATRDLSRRPDQEGRYLGNILVMRLFLSLAAGLGMVGTVAVLGHPAPVVNLTALVAISLVFTSNVDTCSAVFYAHQRMELPAGVGVIATMLRVAASLGALAAGAGVTTLLVIYAAAAALQFGLLFWMLLWHTRPSYRLDPAFWRGLLAQAYPLALANLFSVIYFRVDTVMLASLSGEEAVGLYHAAFRLLEFTLMLPAYYGGAIFPVISASHGAHPQRFLLMYRRSFKYMLMGSLPLALGLGVLAPAVIQVLYGRTYAPSAPVLAVLMGSLVLISVNSINAPYLIVMGRQRTVTLLTAAGMTLNIALNAVAIPRYGILGAAWVTLLSEAVTVVMFLAALRRPLNLRWRMLRHAIRPLAAGALLVAALKLTGGWDLGFQILAGAAVYPAALWLFGAFDEVDRELFGRLLRPTQNGSVKLT